MGEFLTPERHLRPCYHDRRVRGISCSVSDHSMRSNGFRTGYWSEYPIAAGAAGADDICGVNLVFLTVTILLANLGDNDG